jgi:hypothetical protein
MWVRRENLSKKSDIKMTNNFITYGSYGKCLAIIIFIFGILAFLFQTFNNNKGYNLIMILIS